MARREPDMKALMHAQAGQDAAGDWVDDAGWTEDPAANDDAELDLDTGAESGPAFPACDTAAARGSSDDASLVALIGRIVDRDEHAMAAIYDALSGRVYGLVHKFTRRAALTEEVVEDTFWQVWRQAPRFDAARGRASTWVLAMARTRAIDALRREQRFRHDTLPEDDSTLETNVDSTDAHDLLDATRGAQQLHAAIAELDAKARQLVALAFFRGLTHEEIAVQTCMPLGSVKSVIRRALQQLRAQLRMLESE